MTNKSTKECTKCGTEKHYSEFHKQANNSTGYRASCKACRNIESVQYRKENHQKLKEWHTAYRKTETNKANQRASEALDRVKHKQEHKARSLVYSAVKSGRLEREPCKVCNTNENIECHHNDYSTPFDNIDWLCQKHHTELHNRERNAATRRLRPIKKPTLVVNNDSSLSPFQLKLIK